jgi:ribonuclease ZC3H12
MVLVPLFRQRSQVFSSEFRTINPEILDELEEKGYLTFTQSSVIEGRRILPYDDRFILKTVVHNNAVIVSNDNYRDLWEENPDWKRLSRTRLV